ncbi:MAG: class II D-tagatose-bisphosphate aldolase non-catalytic subunit [Desulfobacterales bacterium]
MEYGNLSNLSAYRRLGGPYDGVLSVCSANPWVVDAVLSFAADHETPILIEATASQVNPDGGYTGMAPEDFVRLVRNRAAALNPVRPPMIGSDHMGAYPWRHLRPDDAMDKAGGLVAAGVRAGMVKLHLDASFRCLGDPARPDGLLPADLAARRCASLARQAEAAWRRFRPGPRPLYVIGSDVPPPGGAVAEGSAPRITPAEELEATIALTRESFAEEGIQDAWERVIAVVVQPGVEFSNLSVVDYVSDRAAELTRFLKAYPALVFEAHSTDFQRPEALRRMVADGYSILKAGPWMTFAFRETVFALGDMENELARIRKGITASNIREVLDREMVNHPEHWKRYYAGDDAEQAFLRRYALSDRCRYYWNRPEVDAALTRLLGNLRRYPPPWPLVDQYLPRQAEALRSGIVENTPDALIRSRIQEVIRIYDRACRLDCGSRTDARRPSS